MASSRPLADAPYRSYAGKLERFARFIAPELRSVFAGLGLAPRARVLDVGCGVGIATRMVANLLGSEAQVVGLDLSLPHLHAAGSGGAVDFVQADAARPNDPFILQKIARQYSDLAVEQPDTDAKKRYAQTAL